MSIVLRQITRRAGGGEIARTSTLDMTEVIIGRGTDCDVQILDLAVMLRHVGLQRLASGCVALDALGGVPLNLGGRFVEHGEIDPAKGARLLLGSHQLFIGAGETAGDIVVTVERIAALYDSAEAKDEKRIFSLDGVMPGKRPMVWLSLLAVLGVFLGWPVWAYLDQPPSPLPNGRPGVVPAAFHPDQLWTSGPLSKAHANLSNNCGACHDKAFVSVRDDTCRTCHAKLPDHAPLARMQDARGAPVGRLASAQAELAEATHLTVGRCASCHKEHEGPNGALMVASTFCSDCHGGLKSQLTDTVLANVTDWGKHPQFRATIVTTPAVLRPAVTRVSLDARPRENSGLKFPHRLHLASGGGVARMASELGQGASLDCADCHLPDAGGMRFVAVSMEKNCAGCHDLAFARDRSGVVRTLPHGKPAQVVATMRNFYVGQGGPAPGFTDRRRPGVIQASFGGGSTEARGDAAVRGVFARGGMCFDCHAVVAPTRVGGLDFGIAPVSVGDHYLPKAAFPHNRHTTQKCASCHAAATSDVAADVLLPGVANCQSCHGKVRAAKLVPATCDTCHGYHGVPTTGALPIGHPVAKPAPVRIAQAAARRVGVGG